jgi:DNA-binding response OmpR family regulator
MSAEPAPAAETVLIVDDDPQHLKLYSWIAQKAGFRAVTALVGSTSVDLQQAEPVDVITLDYRLNSSLKAVDVAFILKQTYPGAPLIVLSELEWMPDDIRPFAAAFVNKGEPEQLIGAIKTLLHRRPANV